MRQNHTRTNSSVAMGEASEAPRSRGRRPKRSDDGIASVAEPNLADVLATRVAALKQAATIKAASSTVTRVGRTPVRYDRPGHLEGAHAERLLQLSRRGGSHDEFELVFDAADDDDLATELAEQAVSSMIGGGGTWLDVVNAPVEEEQGGPFVEAWRGRERDLGHGEGVYEPSRDAKPPLSEGTASFPGIRRGRLSRSK